jgi:hypothetical protein
MATGYKEGTVELTGEERNNPPVLSLSVTSENRNYGLEA